MSDFYDPDVYDARVAGIPGEVEFYTRLAKEAQAAGRPVLELACGTGRIAIPIAQEGVRVVGLDLSPSMLARAREKSDGLTTARWEQGDMSRFKLSDRFGLVLIAFRSFQHLLTTKDQLSCLECVHRHLVPGGRLAIDIFNPDIVLMGQWLGALRGTLRQRGRDYVHPGSGRTAKRWESREYRPAEQELEAAFLDEELDEAGVVASRVYRNLKLRYFHRFEMELLLLHAGFEIEALYGDFLGGAFEDTSPEMVWLARPR